MARGSVTGWGSRCIVFSLIVVLAASVTGGTDGDNASPIQSPPAAQAPITGFGGYNWDGTVTSIGAQWNVPTILPSSAPGYASTWIGAQTPVNDRGFIQLGTLEQDGGAEQPRSAASSPHAPQYFAFWSDTQRGFHPVILGTVAPDSLISAAMVKSPSGWKLTLTDNLRRLATGLLVRDSPSDPYNQAEWLQEDPVMTVSVGHDLPYPALSPVAFIDLAVNGHHPRLSFDDAQALSSSNGIFMVPSRFTHDSFTMAPAAGAAKQYLRDALSLDNANIPFAAALRSWHTESAATKRAAVQAFVAAISANRSALAGQAWPPSARPLIGQVVKVQKAAVGFLNFWLTSGGVASGDPPAIPSVDLITPTADRLRSVLGLPPL